MNQLLAPLFEGPLFRSFKVELICLQKTVLLKLHLPYLLEFLVGNLLLSLSFPLHLFRLLMFSLLFIQLVLEHNLILFGFRIVPLFIVEYLLVLRCMLNSTSSLKISTLFVQLSRNQIVYLSFLSMLFIRLRFLS